MDAEKEGKCSVVVSDLDYQLLTGRGGRWWERGQHSSWRNARRPAQVLEACEEASTSLGGMLEGQNKSGRHARRPAEVLEACEEASLDHIPETGA